MQSSNRIWLWLSAAVSFVVGFLLVSNDSAAGWFLIMMGIIDIGVSTRAGQGLAASNPGWVRWGARRRYDVACPPRHGRGRVLAQVTGLNCRRIRTVVRAPTPSIQASSFSPRDRGECAWWSVW